MIRARGLARSFKVKRETIQAVRGVDLDVEAGRLVAFLGPNGAGKSTSLRMLTTLLPPTAGTATVAGRDIASDPKGVRARTGYVGQRSGAGENFRVRDELVNQGANYGLTRAAARRRADEVLETLDLAPLARRRPSTLSGGQRRRLDIGLGLVHRPPLLFLDEPTTGLDPHSRANVWEHILRLRERYGTTLFLTTHYLEEADTMAERVVVIDGGRIIADGTADRLKTEHAGDRIAVAPQDAGDSAAVAETSAHMFGNDNVAADPSGAVRVRVPRADAALPELLRTLEAAGITTATAETSRPTLDDVFLTLTGRSLDEVQGEQAGEEAAT
ncbi:ABC transporter ATP-binding protein [Streptomonospora litoralis]|uniref:Daunorubicin/doxorubicin resistance ATP-binding protein DrrA n=1 Tax=Streptomonospora litoralis TaxID=2498135 RepID=A0A4P6Q2R4_9ACTN|nr:ABC transporter ATP-binding protein [Streptomonospora litoralis]QBI53531.1 Daunorubicin/doxorubicin resistance ATP-binding protein DrrA [Streptomonospora litoralis]